VSWTGKPIRLPAESPADSDKIIEFFERSAVADKGCRWALVKQDGEEFLGTVGFNCFLPEAELAFHLRPEFWGLGLMREAAQEALGWLRMQGPRLKVEAYIEPENVPSIRLARRLGFDSTGTFRDRAERYVLTNST
jgi:ribosomal-protein-alanine N-acetyltransferase